MMNSMEKDLQYLIHFFNNKEHLFKTIMMADACQIDEICDQLVFQQGWYWGRYAKSEREDYLQRRRFVEKTLFDEYRQAYRRLKEKVPVYFYLYPKLTIQKAMELAQLRTKHEEIEPRILMPPMNCTFGSPAAALKERSIAPAKQGIRLGEISA